MSKVLFTESTLPKDFSNALAEKKWDWPAPHAELMFKIVFMSIAKFLDANKVIEEGKQTKTAVVTKDLNGTFCGGASIQFIQNEDPEMPGNWEFVISLDEKDFEDADKKFASSDTAFQRLFSNVAMREYNCVPASALSIFDFMCCSYTTLRNWLQTNVKQGETMEIEIPDYFTAAVEADEAGNIVMSIAPGALIKSALNDHGALDTTANQ